jgi:hypothetical protein
MDGGPTLIHIHPIQLLHWPCGDCGLLDDPETAKYHLRSHLHDVQDSASECKQEAKKIEDKFDYLVRFIAALHGAIKEKQSESLA